MNNVIFKMDAKGNLTMKRPDPKAENRRQLDEISDIGGDLMLMEMFWDMFDDLPATKQRQYVKRAAAIVKNHTGIEWKPEALKNE